MREALLKKRYKIPAALLLVILISIGVASATFLVTTVTKITEPIKITGEIGFTDNMEPGDTNEWTFDVTNESETHSYDISYTVTDGVEDENGVSVTTFTISGNDYLDNLNGDDNKVWKDDTVTVTLENTATANVVLKIFAADNAPGKQTVKLGFAIDRE